MRTIRVTGTGSIRIHPDMTRITIDISGLHRNYETTLRRSAEDTEALKDILEGLGFARSDLKTLSFNIDTEYESYKENDTYKRRFVGYKFSHQMKVEFDSDKELLGKILYRLANSPVEPEFRISYTAKNPEPYKDELLSGIVADARRKAEILAKSAGVRLGGIESIDYSWSRIDFDFSPVEKLEYMPKLMRAVDSYPIDIEPDDIDASDTVTVVWEII